MESAGRVKLRIRDIQGYQNDRIIINQLSYGFLLILMLDGSECLCSSFFDTAILKWSCMSFLAAFVEPSLLGIDSKVDFDGSLLKK